LKISVDHFFLRTGTSAWRQSIRYQKFMRDHPVESIYMHEDYDDNSLRNDICLVRVSKHFNDGFTQRILGVAGQKYTYPTGSICQVYGFGWTDKHQQRGSASDALRVVDVKIIGHQKCQTWYKKRS
ncbi:hypothetical protein ILUMI_18033, partial [Ignelater luminosus]